jgi:hypothetical protein
MAKIEKTPTGEFHSGVGCIIMTIIITGIVLALWWAYYTLTTMDSAIAAVTQSAPAKLPEVAAVPDLQKRLADFSTIATAGKPATLTLSVADLNVLILLAPDSATYKDMLRVKSLDAVQQVVTTDSSLTMNKKFWETDKRYLVGEVDFTLEVTEAGPDAKVSAVRVPGKAVPEKMVQGMQIGYLKPYLEHSKTGPILKAIKQAKVQANGLWVSTVEPPNKEAPKKPFSWTDTLSKYYPWVIIAAIAVAIGAIIANRGRRLLSGNDELAALAQDNPAQFAEVPMKPQLMNKVSDFAEVAIAGETSSLKLSATEINTLIVSAPDVEGTYKNMLRVKSFDPAREIIVADCSLPIETAQLPQDKRPRVVGEIDFHATLSNSRLNVRARALRVEGKTISEALLRDMQAYDYLSLYHSHPTIGPVLKAVKQVKVEADGVVLSTQK